MKEFKANLGRGIEALEKWIISQEFAGYDPYDALNSPLIQSLSFNHPLLKLAFTQGVKQFPVNLRSILRVPKSENQKALGLMLMGFLKRHALTGDDEYMKLANKMITRLEALKSQGYHGDCWGFHFDWQNRSYCFPKYTPTLVNTAFVIDGYLDAYEKTADQALLHAARRACLFALQDLHISKMKEGICFSYTPMDRGQVHNANLLGARMLARVYSYTGDRELAKTAKDAMNYTVSRQYDEGFWMYGEIDIQQYIDNFHTGYVLECLHDTMKYLKDWSHLNALEKGLDYYAHHLFQDGMPKYFHNRLYPVDIHNIQALITLVKCAHVRDHRELAIETAAWYLNHMQSSKGYFYFRKYQFYMNRTPFIRWGQAWAYHSLTTLQHFIEAG